ncbi:MAG: hypothetical protein OEV00_13490 [Acidobacteriota bacterium]|nr:hypothetical protein [Acidobacteriota bacterium]MDH3786324.1 hypothetical protein [Acidobacteriota bacterium]
MKRRGIVFLIAWTLALPTLAGIHPDAPPETTQYSFIIGKWDCTTRFMGGPDGKYVEGRATWTGEYFLGGLSIRYEIHKVTFVWEHVSF